MTTRRLLLLIAGIAASGVAFIVALQLLRDLRG